MARDLAVLVVRAVVTIADLFARSWAALKAPRAEPCHYGQSPCKPTGLCDECWMDNEEGQRGL